MSRVRGPEPVGVNRTLIFWLLVVVTVFFASRADATWEYGSSVTTNMQAAWEPHEFSSTSAVLATAPDLACAALGGGFSVETRSFVSYTPGGTHDSYQFSYKCLGHPTTHGGVFRWTHATEACPVPGEEIGVDSEGHPACAEPPSCEPGGDLGQRFGKDGQLAGDLCMTAYGDGCIAINLGSVGLVTQGIYRTYFELTDQICGGGAPAAAIEPDEDKPNCIITGGIQTCFDPQDTGCGYVNGNRVCTASVPNEGCWAFGDGEMVCGNAANAPPAPDDGTPGQVASPDQVLSDSDGNTVNYYTSTTVNGSAGPSQGTDPTGDGGSGGTDDEGSGSGSASGSCSASPQCEGDPILCALLQQEWHTMCVAELSAQEYVTGAGLDGVPAASELTKGGGDFLEGLDDAGFLTVGSCDLNETVDTGFFGSFTLNFNVWCDVFFWAGQLVLVSAGLISMRILAGAF